MVDVANREYAARLVESSWANPPKSVRIAIIDDHDAVRTGVRTWCTEAVPPILVQAEYNSAAELLTSTPTRGNLDVVTLDIETPDQRINLALIELVGKAGHRIVIYSRIESEEVIMKCLDLGAMSYIAKSEGREHLLDAIRHAAVDVPHVSPLMANAMNKDRRLGRPRLSPREQEVLLAWFQTESKERVARQLYMSPGSVKTYLQRVRAKYAAVGRPAPTKAALVARAAQDGIISVNDL